MITKKESIEELYKINLSDLNTNSVKMDAVKKNVFVYVSTTYHEKIIRYY